MLNSIEDARGYFGKSPSVVFPQDVIGYLDAIEKEIAERYAELPVDMDGKPIHVGDIIQIPSETYGFGGEVEVCAVSKGYVCYGQGKHFCKASICRKHKPTVEEILEKALNEAASLDRKEGYWPSAAAITNIVNETAPQLQLRENKQ